MIKSFKIASHRSILESMQNILEVKNLTKKFGAFTAVKNISFTIKEGEIVGLLGPNGAGKTTTISLLLGLLTPTRGNITVFGKDLQSHREEILEQANFSSAYIEFPAMLNARENLNFFAMLYGMQERGKRIEELISLFGITPFARQWYVYLSSGQQMRVRLAKAFLNQPRILYLDEPTAALDPDVADIVRKLIISMQKQSGMTVLLTSHNMAEVEEVCDRVLFIDHGKLVAEDTPEGLARRITRTKINLMIKDGLKRTLTYCQKHNFNAHQEGRYLTVTVSEEEIIYFLTFLAERGIVYQEISIDRPTLEDYFLEQIRGTA